MKNLVYDKETGLIHRVIESMCGGETIENLHIDKDKYNIVTVDANDIDPFKDAVATDKFGVFSKISTISDIMIQKTKINDEHYNHVGWITSYGIKCGIAKYSEYILEHFLPKCTIFCNYDAISDDSRINKSWKIGATNLDDLYSKIIDSGIDCVVIQFGNGFFKDEAIISLVKKLKQNKIRVVLTLHTIYVHDNLLKMADDLILLGDSIIPHLKKKTMAKIHYIPIGCFDEPKKINGIFDKIKKLFPKKERPLNIGTFGFMFPHKQFEMVMDVGDIIKQKTHRDINVKIYAAYHDDKRDVCEAYHTDLKQNAFYSKCNIEINTNFIPDAEILRLLSECDFLIFPYSTMAGQIQSAAVNMGVSSGAAVITADCFDIPDVKENGPIVKISDIDARKTASVILYMLQESGSGKEMYDSLIRNARGYRNKNRYINVAIEYQKITRALYDVKARVWGPTRSFFSFSKVNRNIAKALYDQGVDVTVFPDKPALDFHNDKLINSLIHKDNLLDNKRTEIVMTYPPRFNNPEGNFIICPWETSKSPKEWTESLNKFEKILAISDYNIDALVRSGVKRNLVEKIHLGVDESIYNPHGEKANLSELINKKITDDMFIFLHLCHMQPRKGSDILLEAYVKEFSRDENVLMLYKSHDGCLFDTFMDKIASNTGKDEKEIPKYAFVMANLKENDVASVYRACDVLTHTHRGECFGLPLAEAMACGIPLITTRYAGPLEYATDENSWFVKHKESNAQYHVEVDGAKWAEPNIDSIRAALRNAFENRDIVKKKGLDGAADMRGKGWDVTAYEIIRMLKHRGA